MARLTIGIKVEKAVRPHAWGGLTVEGVGGGGSQRVSHTLYFERPQKKHPSESRTVYLHIEVLIGSPDRCTGLTS